MAKEQALAIPELTELWFSSVWELKDWLHILFFCLFVFSLQILGSVFSIWDKTEKIFALLCRITDSNKDLQCILHCLK